MAKLNWLWVFVLFHCLGITASADKPNVVLFLVDDLGWTDLGCYGSSFYETPNVDRLAASGLKFTDAYAACPVCSPTRASIMTGRYPQRYGITDYISPNGGNQPEKWKRKTEMLPASYADRLPHNETTLAESFKQNGYATFFAGKWHLGPEGFWPENQGFDVNRGGIDRGGPYGGKKYFSPYGNPRLTDGPEGEHLPDRLASETVKFIQENREGPFLAMLSFYSVHTPLISREDLKQKYLEKKKSLPPNQELWGQERARKVRLVQEHAVYAGMIEAMDLAVGKVLDELETLGLDDNTIVMFTSDNGGLSTSEGHPTSNLPLRAGKGWMYEGGIRVPLIVRAPGVSSSGATTGQYVSSVDFYPTLHKLAGLSCNDVDGVDFSEVLSGGEVDRGPIFWHYPHYGNQGGAPSSAIRNGPWKLIRWLEDDSYELFHVVDDQSESKPVTEENADVVAELSKSLDAWLDEVGAAMPTHR